MEAAWLDALKMLPGAAIVGVPLGWAVRALWAELTKERDRTVKIIEDKIRADMTMATALDKLTDTVQRLGRTGQ